MKAVFRHIWITLTLTSLLFSMSSCSVYMIKYALRPNMDKYTDTNLPAKELKYYPFLGSWVDSLKQCHSLHDTTIVNRRGLRLHAIYIKANHLTYKTAIIIHGYTRTALAMLNIAYMYNHDLQYNVLLPDLQHHGKSQGKAVTMGWKDRLDILQWAKVANELFGDNTAMVIHGVSMGGATTMMVSGEQQPLYIKCYVEDCGYTSVWDEYKGELKKRFHLPTFPTLYDASFLCKLKYGWSFKEASSLKQVSKCKLPMLFIHGDADKFVPTWMVYPLYNAKPGPKELWIVHGATHAMSYDKDPKAYSEKVRCFIDKYIKR